MWFSSSCGTLGFETDRPSYPRSKENTPGETGWVKRRKTEVFDQSYKSETIEDNGTYSYNGTLIENGMWAFDWY